MTRGLEGRCSIQLSYWRRADRRPGGQHRNALAGVSTAWPSPKSTGSPGSRLPVRPDRQRTRSASSTGLVTATPQSCPSRRPRCAGSRWIWLCQPELTPAPRSAKARWRGLGMPVDGAPSGRSTGARAERAAIDSRPRFWQRRRLVTNGAPVAQLDRASDFESESRRFKSCRAYWWRGDSTIMGQ